MKTEKAAKYFKSKKGFNSLFTQFLEKYRSYGRPAGTVIIKNATDEEKEAISNVTGDDYTRVKDIKIKLSDFEKNLNKTIFKGVDFHDLLEAYFETKIVSKKEQKEEIESIQKRFLTEIKPLCETENALIWFRAIEERQKGTGQIYTSVIINKKRTSETVSKIIQALNRLPDERYVRLSIFSTLITDDPHYFDIDQEPGRLFISALQIILEHKEGKEYITLPNSEQIADILSSFMILRDDINNYTTIYGLGGTWKNGDNILLLSAANKDKMVINLPLREIDKFNDVYAVKDTVFIIENSGLYSSIIDELIKREINASVICSSGQIRIATWEILNRLKRSTKIYYSGDYDPEGILMAIRLKKRFNERLIFWRYNKKDYLKAISDVKLTENRLNQIKNVREFELLPLIEEMVKRKRSGYQEKIMDDLVNDISRINSNKG